MMSHTAYTYYITIDFYSYYYRNRNHILLIIQILFPQFIFLFLSKNHLELLFPHAALPKKKRNHSFPSPFPDHSCTHSHLRTHYIKMLNQKKKNGRTKSHSNTPELIPADVRFARHFRFSNWTNTKQKKKTKNENINTQRFVKKLCNKL